VEISAWGEAIRGGARSQAEKIRWASKHASISPRGAMSLGRRVETFLSRIIGLARSGG